MARWCEDHDACLECGRTEVRHAGRGLCRTCHCRNSKKGTLSDYNRRSAVPAAERMPQPDFLYRKWILSTRPKRMGADGWSELGRWCGDGSLIDDGCGTFFHEHVANGLCGECCLRYSGVFEGEARDVRVCREVMA